MTAQTETDFIASIGGLDDLTDALAAGVGEQHFVERLREWRWVTNYVATTREFPPVGLITGQFPDFQPSPDVGAMRFQLGRLLAAYVRRMTLKIIEEEGGGLEAEDPTAATRAISGRLMELTATHRSSRAYLDAEAPERAAALDRGELERRIGIPTGLEPMEVMGRRWMPGDLGAVIARPGAGKTELMVATSVAAWQAGHRVAFFTMEMTAEQIMARADPIMMRAMGVDGPTNTELQSGYASATKMQAFRDYATTVSGRKDWLVVDGSMSAMGLTEVMAFSRQHRAELVVIDGVKLLESGSRGRGEWERYVNLVRGCKQMALTEQVTVLIVEHAYGTNARRQLDPLQPPSIDDVFMGKAIGQESDVVISIAVSNSEPYVRTMLMPKNREGITINLRKRISCDIDVGDVGRWLESEDKKLSDGELGPFLRAQGRTPEPPPAGKKREL